MSARFALAAEQAKRFRDSMALVFEALDYLSAMEDPAALEANIKRLKADGDKIIANYRAQAQQQAEAALKSGREAHERKLKDGREQLEKDRAKIIADARKEAATIIADARKQADELQSRVQKAHAAAQEAMR